MADFDVERISSTGREATTEPRRRRRWAGSAELDPIENWHLNADDNDRTASSLIWEAERRFETVRDASGGDPGDGPGVLLGRNEIHHCYTSWCLSG